jgi:hypothetical protein
MRLSIRKVCPQQKHFYLVIVYTDNASRPAIGSALLRDLDVQGRVNRLQFRLELGAIKIADDHVLRGGRNTQSNPDCADTKA